MAITGGTKEDERRLRLKAERISPALVIDQPSSFDEYARQLMVPPAVMDLARKASGIRLAAWEIQAIRELLDPSPAAPRLLRQILIEKATDDDSHPPYIRVACTGRGVYDDLARDYGYEPDGGQMTGSPVVLEIWPAQHYSPIHSHGETTGIIYCLAGQLDVMSYSKLEWEAEKRALVTLTPGQCAWLTKETYAVHKVHCLMDGGSRAVRDPQRHRRIRRQLPRLPQREGTRPGRLRARPAVPRQVPLHQREDKETRRLRHLFGPVVDRSAKGAGHHRREVVTFTVTP
ncbi:cupin domain-containing protein [Streptomyces diastatochromogenes]|uniref:hypothetical protein n=1 Tax=Streptomyces diastatochromogenes TaxID=42236 RepID=UPI0036757D22